MPRNKLTILRNDSFLMIYGTLSLPINNIKLIEDNAFKNCTNLTVLDISENNIEKINQNTFNGLNTLQTLRIGNNKIFAIENNSFIQCFWLA